MNAANRKYYFLLFAVVIFWGLDPIATNFLYDYYSAAALAAFTTLVSALAFLILMRKDLKKLNFRFLRVAFPICLVNSLACMFQRIGLQYTTPARYAFFEHLSCVAVPLILFIFFRRRPSTQQCFAAILCLAGCLLLAGADVVSGTFGIGDVLCMLAGIFLGIGIITTSEYTKDMDIRLFMVVHMCTYFISSFLLMLAMNYIPVNGAPMESIVFSLEPLHLIAAAAIGILTIGLCWLMRNEATRHLSPNTIAVFAPIAAVITAFTSILLGIETAAPATLIAFVLILSAAILAGLGEAKQEAKPAPKEKASEAEDPAVLQ